MDQLQQHQFRSECPINFALEIFGDKWSLLIVRDMIFAGKSTYNDFLDSQEKIATNILASRLKMLEDMGIIQKERDPSLKTKTKYVYRLTPGGIDLIPLIVEIMLWSESRCPLGDELHAIVKRAHRDKQALIEDLRRSAKARKPLGIAGQ
jgi:DNA-binding HxlR family transcriptional regulator